MSFVDKGAINHPTAALQCEKKAMHASHILQAR